MYPYLTQTHSRPEMANQSHCTGRRDLSVLDVSSERSLTLVFRLELPLENETCPWLLLELRLLSPLHSLKPGLFENLLRLAGAAGAGAGRP